MSLRIGRRASTDLDRLALFALRAQALRHVVDDWDDAAERARFDASFRAGDHVVVVTDDDPMIAAAFRVDRKRHEIAIAELYVAERHRRKGIAQQIVRELVDESLRADVPLAIQMPPRAQPAIALVRKMGFAPVPSRERGRVRFVWRVA